MARSKTEIALTAFQGATNLSSPKYDVGLTEIVNKSGYIFTSPKPKNAMTKEQAERTVEECNLGTLIACDGTRTN